MHIWTITSLLFSNNLWTLQHIKKMSGKVHLQLILHIELIKQFYTKKIISGILVKELTVLKDKLK
jgi:hypothetical protein